MSDPNILELGSEFAEWQRERVTDEELSTLQQAALEKVRCENALYLLPLCGFLHLKGKIWTGDIEKLTYNRDSFKSSDLPKNKELYLFCIEPRPSEELKAYHGNDPNSFHNVPINTFLTTFDNLLEEGDEQMAFYASLKKLLSNYKPFVNARSLCLRKDLHDRLVSGAEKCFPSREIIEAYVTILHDATSAQFVSVCGSVPGYEIREMTFDEALFAAKNWKFASAESDIRFTSSQSFGMGIGAFKPGSTCPVSWAFASWEGVIAALQTLPEHRRKGLGKAVVKKLASKLLNLGLMPYAFIEEVNSSHISESFFDSLGFKVFKDFKFCWRWWDL